MVFDYAYAMGVEFCHAYVFSPRKGNLAKGPVKRCVKSNGARLRLPSEERPIKLVWADP
jgi:hypothetical protein